MMYLLSDKGILCNLHTIFIIFIKSSARTSSPLVGPNKLFKKRRRFILQVPKFIIQVFTPSEYFIKTDLISHLKRSQWKTKPDFHCKIDILHCSNTFHQDFTSFINKRNNQPSAD